MVKTSPYRTEGARWISGQETKIPCGQGSQNIKQKQYCDKFNRRLYKWSTSKRERRRKNRRRIDME